MVSIIARSDYIRQFESDPYTKALVDFLLEKELSKNNKALTSNADEISKHAFYALQNNDKVLFANLYEEISRRKPKPESDWMYNDVLLFAVTLGVKKFDLQKQWLDEVLSIRIKHSHEESRLVTQTFIDILKENLENANNHQPLMIVLKYLLSLSLGGQDYVNSVFQTLTKTPFPHSKVAFVNIICLKAYEIIILSKGLIDLDRHRDIDDFITHFNKRIDQIATFFWLLLLLLILVFSVKFLLFYLSSDSQQAENINRLLTILPFFGFGGLIVPVFMYKKKIISFFKKPFFWYYGYKLKDSS